MRCPICGKPVERSDPEMPFCSERCRLLDLGNWASEKYVISSPIESSDASSETSGDTGEDDEDGA
jgi:uncharacterized protein